jgi:hypothetical protein
MKQDDFSRAPAAAHNALNLKAVPLHSQMEGVFWLPALRFIVHCKDPFPARFGGVIFRILLLSVLHRILKIS